MFRGATLVLVVILVGLIAGCGGEEAGAPGDSGGGDLQRVEQGQVVYGTSFINPLIEVSGEVLIGEESFVAGNTVLNAEEGQRVEIGNQTNAQDNVAVRALGRVVDVSDEAILAHHAIIEDSEIGDFVFLGFNSQVRNSTLEDGAFVLHGARVENVVIPENALVRAGQAVTDQATADALPTADEASEEFRREVLEVIRDSPRAT